LDLLARFAAAVVLVDFFGALVAFFVLFGLAVLLAVVTVFPASVVGAGAGVCAANDRVASPRARAISVFSFYFSSAGLIARLQSHLAANAENAH